MRAEHLTTGEPDHARADPGGHRQRPVPGLGLDPADPVAAAGSDRGRPHPAHRPDPGRGLHFVGAVLATGFDALVNGRANAMTLAQGLDRATPLADARRAPGVLAAALPADHRRRGPRAGGDARRDRQHRARTAAACGSARNADPYDGLLDVTIIHPVGRLKLLRLLPLMYSGRFARDACVEQLRVREVTVEGPGLVGFGDGEMIGAAPLTGDRGRARRAALRALIVHARSIRQRDVA